MSLVEQEVGDVTVAPEASRSTIDQYATQSRLLDVAFANSHEAVVIVDDSGDIVYVTQGAGRLIGHDAGAAIGSSIFDYLHADDVDATAQLFVHRLGYGGHDLGHEVRLRHKSGEWLPVTANVAVMSESDFGVCAITLRTADASGFIERSLRSQIVVAEYTNQLSARFMEATASRDVVELIVESSGQIGLLTGAEIVEVFLEDERGTMERLTRWLAPDRPVGDVTVVDGTTPAQRAAESMLTEVRVIDDVDDAVDEGLVDFARRAGVSSLLSAPIRVGRQRGALVLMRVVPGPDWIPADVDLVEGASGLYGRALHTARTEALLALTYRHGPLGVSIRTWDGDLVDCNQQYLDLFAMTRATAFAINLTEIVGMSDCNTVAARLVEMRRGAVDRLRFHVEMRRPDGSRFWAQAHSVPLGVPGRPDTLVLTSIEDVTEIHAQRVEIEHAALHDSLTGIGNRTALIESIERLDAGDGQYPAVLLVDVDRFKLINDSFGHDTGDHVLREVARRISGELRPDDVFARLGGDEFAIVVRDLAHGQAVDLARRLLRAIDRPIDVDGQAIRHTISIGVALSDGNDGAADPADLMKRADRALYAAKAAGRNTHVVFDESLERAVVQQRALERDLREALTAGELQMHFQPEFSLVDGRVLGAEALLRWVHPERGMIPADEFIVVAERSGLIDDIGRFALREACRAFVTIPGTDGMTLRVNISAREFSRPELPDLVEAALAESGLEPGRLCLEMTETTLMDTPESALAIFERLSALGVHSAIDDFGTGYSSLSYLKRFPVDVLKIDREFVGDVVTDPESRAIVAAIVQLADAMAMEVVAEGVETVEQVDVLRALGCERAQGFLVSPALPADGLAHLLRVRRHTTASPWLGESRIPSSATR